jgi:hypothetical protein
MGVNHKAVKQLIAQKKKTVTDRQFFTSRILAMHFADMAAAQTRRYGYSRRVKMRIVWEPKNGSLACTENEYIWINAGSSFVTKRRTRQERYDIVCGLFAHELGHILYTDFLSAQTHVNRLETGRWYPEKPLLHTSAERRHEADLWDYAGQDPKNLAGICRVAQSLSNIIEDGYVESKMLSRYPGVLGYSLNVMRDVQFKDAPTLTQMIEEEDSGDSHLWLTLTNLILAYVLWGEMKYGETPLTDERVQIVFSLIEELDSALGNPSSKERLNTVNSIMIACWPIIKEFLEYCKTKSAASGIGKSAIDLLSELLSSLKGGSKEATGGSTPVTERAGSKPTPASAGDKRAATARMAASKPKEEPEDEEPTAEEPTAIASPTEVDEPSSADPLGDADAGGSSGKAGDTQKVGSEEGGRSPVTQTDRLYAPEGGQTEFDNDYGGSGYGGAAKDIDRILDQVAEESVCADLETARTRELNELASGISYGDIHKGMNIVVHRMANVPDELVEAYKEAAPPLLHISKLLQRSITQHLQDKRRGGKQTGLLMGRRLDMHALPRKDGHIFYKNVLPAEAPEMAVGLLLDESGSMDCRDRATYARAAAVILHDFCKALRIPVMVYGHTETSTVDLFAYSEFDEIDSKDCYRLMDIAARSNNRDGAALRYVSERLAARPEEIKMLILISDGQPAATGYYGTAAEEDLRGIQHEYRRKGILFIAASIGDDRESLQRIYGDAYMDITDLSRLPIQLTEVVKRHIRA